MRLGRKEAAAVIFFITFLRALAACFITNAHYTGIYPTDLIANGGLIGDVLFFAVSGYCLFNVKYELSVKGFAGWYGKRIWRVYPPVLIMTAIFMIAGAYTLLCTLKVQRDRLLPDMAL
jgi:peptidoglycan/LPS O-acetylase OafA/YrhL